MIKHRFRLGENEKEIIKCIGLGLFVVASVVMPTLPVAVQPIIKMRGHKGFRKLLKNLEKKRYISLGGEKIKLTKGGKALLRNIRISELTFERANSWDGVWRLVSYDVPEIYKKDRDLFRSVLERNGFRKIQESLWVFPYECKERIAILAKDLGLSSFVVVMTTDHLPNQEEMLENFDLV